MVSDVSKQKGFKIEQLFGSKTRTRLLSHFLHNADQRYFVRELARKIDAQLNSVRRELINLMDIGIIKEIVEVDGKEKKKFYAADQDFFMFQDLRALFKKVQLMMKKSLVQEIDSHGKVVLLVLTGRFVDNATIPVDMLVIGEIKEEDLQKLLTEFEKEVGQEVNYTVMTKEEYLYRKQVSDRFLYSILNVEHVTMIDRLKEIKEVKAV